MLGVEMPLFEFGDDAGEQFAALSHVARRRAGVALLLIADEAGVEVDLDAGDPAAGVADFEAPPAGHEEGAVGAGDLQGVGFRIVRIDRQDELRVLEFDFGEMDDAAGELGFVEIEDHAFEPGDFMAAGRIGKNAHFGGDHAAQREVAQAADFDMHALFADFAFDGGAPGFRQAGVVGPPERPSAVPIAPRRSAGTRGNGGSG